MRVRDCFVVVSFCLGEGCRCFVFCDVMWSFGLCWIVFSVWVFARFCVVRVCVFVRLVLGCIVLFYVALVCAAFVV